VQSASVKVIQSVGNTVVVLATSYRISVFDDMVLMRGSPQGHSYTIKQSDGNTTSVS
jgi:hypothetical protein